MNKLLKAVKEASISVACLLDDIAVDENNDIKIFELQKSFTCQNGKSPKLRFPSHQYVHSCICSLTSPFYQRSLLLFSYFS